MTESERYAGDREASRSLRACLADELERRGAVRSPHWRAAVEAVPREVFLPSFFADEPGPDGITRYAHVSRDSGEDAWLSLVHQDRTWVTQLDHGTTAGDGGEPVLGVPTSSSTAPSVVVGMLEDLDVPQGKRIYEAGSGTGYSTALACARYGDAFVTSTEHDPRLSALVGERLASLGSALARRDAARPVDVGVDPAVLESAALMWAAQVALPGTVRVGLITGEVSGRWFLHPDGSWAVLETSPSKPGKLGKAQRAYEGGPQRLWTRLEETASRWLADGRPGIGRYGLTVAGRENTVWLDTPDRAVGALPAGTGRE